MQLGVLVVDESNTGMKICPYCAELIQIAALKCHYCGAKLGPAKTLSRGSYHNRFRIICTGAIFIILLATVSIVMIFGVKTMSDLDDLTNQRIKQIKEIKYPDDPKLVPLPGGLLAHHTDTEIILTNLYNLRNESQYLVGMSKANRNIETINTHFDRLINDKRFDYLLIVAFAFSIAIGLIAIIISIATVFSSRSYAAPRED